MGKADIMPVKQILEGQSCKTPTSLLRISQHRDFTVRGVAPLRKALSASPAACRQRD